MLTAAQCRAKAASFAEMAALALNVLKRDDYLALETGWLRVAAMADHQDAFQFMLDDRTMN
jgi:hypothetical protein